METVVQGKFVCVDYKGTLEGGDIFDTSEGGQPIEVHIGAGQIVKGFEEALMGMVLNEKKVFTLNPEDAYGDRDESYMHTFSREEIPPDVDPQVGEVIGLHTPDGQQIPAQITHADNTKVVVDLNHPLAGKSLTFEIEIVGISDTPTQVHECGGGCSCGC